MINPQWISTVSSPYPEKLDVNNPDLEEAWEEWYEEFELFITTSQLEQQTDALKISHFLKAIGPEARQWIHTVNLTTVEKKIFDKVVAGFAAACSGERNLERQVFLGQVRSRKVQ